MVSIEMGEIAVVQAYSLSHASETTFTCLNQDLFFNFIQYQIYSQCMLCLQETIDSFLVTTFESFLLNSIVVCKSLNFKILNNSRGISSKVSENDEVFRII